MYIHNLSLDNSVLNNFIFEIRDISVQNDKMRFRRNIERIGEILSYEMSKTLLFNSVNAKTPLGSSTLNKISDDIVICSVLRAGLPLHNGVLNYFDSAENAFISAYRHHLNDKDFEIVVEYIASPKLDGKTLLLVDPMLATGKSLALTYEALLSHGTPKNVHILSVIGADAGVNYIKNCFPENTHLWIATVDKKLNDKGYIVPGLGDAGDLAYGTKLRN
ncbi:uracil phosphoribosyltransferase [Pontimicrobium aquaticum]|uniref:Uracil phosphoribosyltransferase n=1 Tax=Pontimicrobium aquaticum TaxID=2565367 RepID=A0A4U0ESP8_9FLAO|nr:uracil phosphoribosyltransferase [Pontimicrobium aquaticum]TJY34750.1 uracil phosphoribosyltransferase [Pontimicrobium aquaticum]